MGVKDTVTKEYMKDAEIFADAFNFLIYNGEQVIKPESLHELDTTSIVLPYGDDSKKVPVQKYRDVLKMVTAMGDGKTAYLVLGIENQTDIHYAMPVRAALYDMIQYANQVDAAVKSHRTANNSGETHDEFLSGFHKTDRLLPVVTLVIYFGASKWDAPRTIHDMLSINDNRVLAFTPDYKINLIAPEEITDESFKKFHTELCELLKYIKYSNDKSKLKSVLNEDTAFRSLSRMTADVISKLTNSPIKISNGEEKIDMCKAIEDMINEGKAEGRAEAIAEGEAKLAEAIKNLMQSLKIDESKAKELLGLTHA